MAGLSMFVKFDKEEFIGKEALLKQKTEGVSQRLRGIELDDNAIPRHGYKVLKDGVEVGEVTTGYHLISVDKSCAVAFGRVLPFRWVIDLRSKFARRLSQALLLRRNSMRITIRNKIYKANKQSKK